jgi:predicted ArsR family transcriptional regulator
MKSSTQVTQLEFILLELVAKGEGKWSWYELANALSRRDVPREPDMMVVLKQLAADGLLIRHMEAGSPRDRWELTAEGNAILIEQTNEKIKLATKKLIERELENFDEEQLAQVLNFIEFLKFQNVGDRLQEKKSNLPEMFGEFASEDRVMAEEGMAEYAELLRREDGD